MKLLDDHHRAELDDQVREAFENFGRAYFDYMDQSAKALAEARELLRLRRMMGRRPLVGWNPALERVSNG